MWSFPTKFLYFITFKDDYTRYDHLYLIHEKSQSLDTFKLIKVEVELQLGKKIKGVNSDCRGEYCGRYDGSREQRPGPFVLFQRMWNCFAIRGGNRLGRARLCQA
jgi:hypothetical protein